LRRRTTLSTFVSLQQHATVYDNVGRKIQDSESGGGVTSTLTQYSYDALDRLICTAVRMNASAFASLSFTQLSAPSSYACTLGPQGRTAPTGSPTTPMMRPASSCRSPAVMEPPSLATTRP